MNVKIPMLLLMAFALASCASNQTKTQVIAQKPLSIQKPPAALMQGNEKEDLKKINNLQSKLLKRLGYAKQESNN